MMTHPLPCDEILYIYNEYGGQLQLNNILQRKKSIFITAAVKFDKKRLTR